MRKLQDRGMISRAVGCRVRSKVELRYRETLLRPFFFFWRQGREAVFGASQAKAVVVVGGLWTAVPHEAQPAEITSNHYAGLCALDRFLGERACYCSLRRSSR